MNNKIYLCFDIGATTTKWVHIDKEKLIVIKRGVFSTILDNKPFSSKYLIDNVLNVVNDSFEEHKNNIIGIGIATTGGVDVDRQEIIHANDSFKDYIGVNWKRIIQDKYNIKVVTLNDVKAAGIYEFSNRPIKNGVMLTLGTGFGAALFINGKLYNGSNYLAGEVGQMIWPFDNSLTFDTACSAVLATNKIANLINDKFFKLSEDYKIKNNKEAIKIKKDWILNISWAIKFLDYFFDPDIFIIGGGVSKHPNLIFEIKEYFPNNFKKIEIATTHNDAAFYGLIKLF